MTDKEEKITGHRNGGKRSRENDSTVPVKQFVKDRESYLLTYILANVS